MKRTPSLLSLYKTSYERRRASAAENTRVPASQGSQSESIIQETETIAIQETQAAVSQKRRTVPTIQETQTTASKKGREVTSSQVSHKRGTHLMCSKTSLFDNDNGNSNGRDDDDDDEEEEPWQPIDADPGTLKIYHCAFLFYNSSFFLI
jgi:hypothetical protein